MMASLIKKNQKMKIFYTKTNFFYLSVVTLAFFLPGCQKETPAKDLTLEIVGTYNGEYREGEQGFTVIVSNVKGTAFKSAENTFDMELELVPGLFSVHFSAQMLTPATFSVQQFDLDGDLLEGQGMLEGNTLNITFFETDTTKAYGSYVAQKQ
jgi:hypothetical protein